MWKGPLKCKRFLEEFLADKAAKEATKRSQIDLAANFSKTEVKSIIKKNLEKNWQ